MAKPDTKVPEKPRSSTAGERLTLPVTANGTIDWERIQPSRRDALRELLAKSNIPPAGAGATGEAAAADLDDKATRLLSSTVYDVLSQLEAIAAVRMFGCSMVDALKHLSYSDTEKTALEGPTSKVLAKYLPATLNRYQDELMLLMLLATMTRNKFAALRDSLGGHENTAEVKTEVH